MFWATVHYTPDSASTVLLDGISNAQADDLSTTMRVAARMFEAAERKRERLEKFDAMLDLILHWKESVTSSAREHRQRHRWVPEEMLQHWLRTKPLIERDGDAFKQLIAELDVAPYFSTKPDDQKKAVDLWRCDLRRYTQALNQLHMEAEIVDCAAFFSTVEKSPLTPEQVRSVICFDNRVLLIASAGSGKTSTMIAKAGYALHRELVTPDQILLLAFNNDAAKELQERIVARLTPLGFDTRRIVANTFHAFGLSILGRATGKKPALAPWVDKGKDVDYLAELIDDLKDRDPSFRAKWDLFRLVFSRDLPDFGKEEESPEDRDVSTKKNGFRTLNGEVVASHSERLIADWLFYNGVKYEYERAYEIDIELTSAKRIMLCAADEIVLQAPKIRFVAQGAQVDIGADQIIEQCKGNFTIKSATFAHVVGGGGEVPDLVLPKSKLKTDERIVLFDRQSGLPVANRGYRIVLGDGQVIEGKTDAKGRTTVLQSTAMSDLEITIEPHADPAS